MPRSSAANGDGAAGNDDASYSDVVVPVSAHSSAAYSGGLTETHSRPTSPRRNAVAAEKLSSPPPEDASTPVKLSTSQADHRSHANGADGGAADARKSRRHHHRRLSEISHAPHALTHSEGDERPAHPTAALAWLATVRTPFHWFNWAWGITFTALVPAAGSIIWFGVIPVGDPRGDISDKAMWVFLINPVSFSFLSYLLMSLFFTALDEHHPHRPFFSYAHILAATYIALILMPGLPVLLDQPFDMGALVSIGITCIITLLGIRYTPHSWFVKPEQDFRTTYFVFMKLVITFMIWTGILAGYMIANAENDGVLQGLITVALQVLGFIAKKCMLQFADPVNLETAMLVGGLWVENLGDVFVTLAFPSAERPGPTYAIIFLLRIAENLAYLWFQLNIWFKFRIWIKGKFKKDQGKAIEEDLPEYEDDRGHSAHHPGYRRRQLRFLVMKIFSQVSSYLYFLALVPVLRYGPNKRRFPYSELPEEGAEKNTDVRDEDSLPERIRLQPDALLKDGLQYLPFERFWQAMLFACIQIVATLASGLVIWLWMHRYHRNIIITVRERYNAVVVQSYHYGLVLSIMLMNSLIGTAFLCIYYCVYFV